MPFAEGTRSRTEARTRTSDNYVRFTPEFRVVLRILDEKARLSWKHWIKQANSGRGMMANCPGKFTCPIDIDIEGLDKDDPVRMERRAKKRYIVNVLDRTPVAVCAACNTQTVKTTKNTCRNCGADTKKLAFVPLNKVKILEHGPKLFEEGLNQIEELQQDEFGKNITQYDITFQTSGEGRDKKIAPVPQSPTDLTEQDFIDPETNEPQRVFNLDDLSEPNTPEEIELLLKGAGVADINQLAGIS